MSGNSNHAMLENVYPPYTAPILPVRLPFSFCAKQRFIITNFGDLHLLPILFCSSNQVQWQTECIGIRHCHKASYFVVIVIKQANRGTCLTELH
jgi:hypothetical protein